MARVDHLVVVAASLAQGVAWCENTLGITPGPGGEHPLMGTHNRLVSVARQAFPRAYLEIIAIQPGVSPTRQAGQQRWFDMDDPQLQARVTRDGPQLLHFVASVSDVDAAVQALDGLGLDRGAVVPASRQTASGLLSWRITVRDDGQRLLHGMLPTLIQWGPVHPTDAMPASGLAIRALRATHPRAPALAAALSAIGMQDMRVDAGPPNLVALLDTPRGPVTLESKGL